MRENHYICNNSQLLSSGCTSLISNPCTVFPELRIITSQKSPKSSLSSLFGIFLHWFSKTNCLLPFVSAILILTLCFLLIKLSSESLFVPCFLAFPFSLTTEEFNPTLEADVFAQKRLVSGMFYRNKSIRTIILTRRAHGV